MDKRELILSLLDPGQMPAYTPAAFFLHFGEGYQQGQAAVDRHLEFFKATGMDFVKIQYEQNYPHLDAIQKPEDWKRMPLYQEEFYEAPLQVVGGLVKAAGHQAMVVVTLYSPFMLAGQASGGLVTEHIRQDPEAVKRGLDIITDSLLIFVRGCMRLGVDGFYASTQGGEMHRFPGTDLFQKVVKPTDLAIWNEINGLKFNILHVCDYQDQYDDLTPFLDYPGQVVNTSLHLGTKTLAPKEVEKMFGRPFMGGMERLGVIATGSQEAIRQAASQALAAAPQRFILAADCTVPSNTPWDNIKTAIHVAHQHSYK